MICQREHNRSLGEITLAALGAVSLPERIVFFLSVLTAIAGTVIAGASWYMLIVAAIDPTTSIAPKYWMGTAAGTGLLCLGLLHDGLLQVFFRALKRTLKNLPVLMPLLILVGALGGLLSWKLAPYIVPWNPSPDASQQVQLIAENMKHLVFMLIWMVLAYPLINAAAIFCWRAESNGEVANASDAYQFAKSRYRRMFRPHLKAVVWIQVGLMVVIPGIIYGLWYAFVDPITATDDKSKSPLERSRRLTQGRRSQILRLWLLFVVFFIPEITMGVMSSYAEQIGPWAIASFGFVMLLMLVVMKMAMFGLYEQRIEDARQRIAAKKAKEAQTAEGDASAGDDRGALVPEPAAS